MEEQTLEIPSAAKLSSVDPTDVVGAVRSKTQSKSRKSNDIRTDKVRFSARRRNGSFGGGGSPPPKVARNLTCPTSLTYRQKVDLPQGPIGNKRKDGEVNAGEREDVVQWILSTCKFEMLDDQTAFGAVDIFDRFLSTRPVFMKKEADYVGVAALLIAMKYYESQAFKTPSLDELIGYMFEEDPSRLHRSRVRLMERKIFAALGWEIDVPTVYTFLLQFLGAAEKPITMTMLDMALFYAKMGMWRNRMVAMLPPQLLAAAALEAASAYTGHKYEGSTEFTSSFKSTRIKRILLLKCSRWMLKLHFYGHVYLHFWWWIPFKN